jgi:hypothetical protein
MTARVLHVPFAVTSGWVWHPDGYFATFISTHFAIDFQQPPVAGGAQEATGGPPPRWRNGDPIRSVRRAVEPVPLPQVLRDHIRDSLRAEVRAFQGRTTGPAPEVPKFAPVMHGVRFGMDGTMWVAATGPDPSRSRADTAAAATPVQYDVFEDDGAYLGRLSIASCTLAAMRGDEIWCLNPDPRGERVVTKDRIVWR